MTAEELAEIPAIDIRTIPHQERHTKIFSMLEALEPGHAFAVISDHEPRPLQYQIDANFPDVFGWAYVEEGPEVWRVLAKAHDLRNLAEYEGHMDVDQRLVDALLTACKATLEAINVAFGEN